MKTITNYQIIKTTESLPESSRVDTMEQRSIERTAVWLDQLHVPTTDQLSTEAYKQQRWVLIRAAGSNETPKQCRKHTPRAKTTV